MFFSLVLLPRRYVIHIELPVTSGVFLLKNAGKWKIMSSLLVKDLFCLALQHCSRNLSPLPLYESNALSTEVQATLRTHHQTGIKLLFPVFLPEGTAAVLKGTDPNMSVLAGSDWDEDGIKASPGVAGVCKKTGTKLSGDRSAAASAAHTLLSHQ